MSELTVLVILGVFVLSLVWYGIGFLDGYRRGIKAGRRLENAELLSLGRRSEVHRPLSYDLVDDSMPAVSEGPPTDLDGSPL